MVERNADVPQEKRIEFRIGINVGDIIIDGDDIYGDGVNIAARLEALAEPGGICVSGRVHEECAASSTSPSKMPASSSSRTSRGRCGSIGCGSHGDCGNGGAGAGAPRQAVDRRPAVPEHERRSRAGVLRRRHGGRDHHRAVAHALAVRDRAQFELHLQGPGRRREAGRARAGRALRARRQRAQGGEPGAHHRRSSSMPRPARISGRTASTVRSRTSSICRTR